ncbi:MAG: hypothetical protein V2A79_07050 [Planctomycetota bacterium]
MMRWVSRAVNRKNLWGRLSRLSDRLESRSYILVVGLVWGLVLGVGKAEACGCDGGKKAKADPGVNVALPKCPVTSEPVDFAVSIRTDQGPVFFNSVDGLTEYRSSPEKYAEAVSEQRKTLSGRPKVQVTCPVSGKPVDDEVFVEREGQKVCFCSEDCVAKFKNEPSKYEANLANSYSYQTKCPVSGGEINPSAFAELPNGQQVFFCCAGCAPRFQANLAEYAPNLAAQGIRMGAGKMSPKMKTAHGEDEARSAPGAGEHAHDH